MPKTSRWPITCSADRFHGCVKNQGSSVKAAAVKPKRSPGEPLFCVREDLTLTQGRATPEGEPTWTIHDPLTQRFHELDRFGFAILCEGPSCASAEEAAQHASAAIGAEISVADVVMFVRQMELACLTEQPVRGWRELWHRRQSTKQGAFAWLLQNYLFIRIPLFHPDRFLEATLPFARIFWSRSFLTSLAISAVAGLYLASRQWDEFADTFLRFLTLEGVAGYFAALIVLKVFHEFGHAYAAKRYGCRVPTMGVAFMVLAPVLYTDVSEIWKLKTRRQRLIVDLGGILVELGIAGLAILAWSLLPSGVLKSVAFFAATTSVVMSLAINLSPLMRFDGYYILSDVLNIPNLQQRAFALLRWRVRRTLFGLQDARPEPWSGRREAVVFAYGLATILYRLVLFTGIAALVYAKTFKALGIVLFCVEIVWFILRPIGNEMRIWWDRRNDIARSYKSVISGLFVCGLVAFVVAPWSGSIEAPAVIEPVSSYRLTTTTAGQLASVDIVDGARVETGQSLFRLESPRIDAELERTRTHLALIRYRLERKAVDHLDLQEADVLEHELLSWQGEESGLERERDELTIRATSPGRVVDLEEDLHAGRWIEKGANLGALVSDGSLQVRGYADEQAAARVAAGAHGRFIPEDLSLPAIAVELSRVATAPTETLDIPYIASNQGGPVYVSMEKNHSQQPIESQFALIFRPLGFAGSVQAVLRGTVIVDGERQSLARGVWNRFVGIMIRESGF